MTRERVLLDRSRPFTLFLKLGGDFFAVHFQLGRLEVTLGSNREKA